MVRDLERPTSKERQSPVYRGLDEGIVMGPGLKDKDGAISSSKLLARSSFVNSCRLI